MHLTIKARDGPARTGILTIHDTTIHTPSILTLTPTTIPNTIHLTTIPTTLFSPHPKPTSYLLYPNDLPLPFQKETLTSSQKTPDLHLIPPTPELLTNLTTTPGTFYTVTNAAQLYHHQTAFVAFITTLRQTLAPESLLYLPAIATPTTLAILTYLGADLTDTTQAHLAAHHHTLLFPTGPIPQTDLTELPCHCPTCTTIKDPTTMTCSDILTHNIHALTTEAQHIRTAITRGTLREHVETRVRADPHATALLRLLDHNHPAYLEEATPLTRRYPLLATTREALTRPEVRRYQHRVLYRYHKPPTAHILLLLPCAAHKPYSESKSHTLFRAALLASPNPWAVHELIVTSPLGLVPRELEIVPPASCYDIAVTGHWDDDEKTMITRLLRHYLAANRYDQIISHLGPHLHAIVEALIPGATVTCVDIPTSDASLDRLKQELGVRTAQYPRVSPAQHACEEVSAVAAYQFGPAIAAALMKDSAVRGRYPYRKILKSNKQLGMITDRGLISLTFGGAQACAAESGYSVTIADDFRLIGSVFAPGIIQADPGIRIGDDVWVRQNNMVRGVGVATMSGPEMNRARHGEAIRIRHRHT